MARLAEKDMELSCDLVVMADCGMAEREAYSMAILRTVREAKSKNMQMSTAFSGGKEELKMRFENIFDMTQKKRGIALFLAAALVSAAVRRLSAVRKAKRRKRHFLVRFTETTQRKQCMSFMARSCNISATISALEKFWGYCHCPKG